METRLTVPPGQPEVWVAPLHEWPLERTLGLLTAEEEARRLRYRLEADRRRFAIGRALVRLALARRLQCAPGEVRIALEPGGRPRLDADHPQVAFSLSHSGSDVVLAVAAAQGHAIGIDVEAGERLSDLDALAGQVCSPAEALRMSGLPPAQRGERFLRLWTLKEAFLKAMGEGLARDPRGVAFAEEEGERPRLAEAGAGWQFAIARRPGGGVMALAVHGLPEQLDPRFGDTRALLGAAP